MGAAVGGCRHEDVRARLQQVQEGGADGGHAAGNRQRGLGALQRRQLRGQGELRGVVVAARVADRVVPRRALEGKGGRLKDGGDARAIKAPPGGGRVDGGCPQAGAARRAAGEKGGRRARAGGGMSKWGSRPSRPRSLFPRPHPDALEAASRPLL